MKKRGMGINTNTKSEENVSIILDYKRRVKNETNITARLAKEYNRSTSAIRAVLKHAGVYQSSRKQIK
jgi:hypothetical protein